MKITQLYDPIRCATKYELEITDLDLINAHFDGFDRLLLRECGESGSVADWLLALETITRKIEQAHAERQKKLAAKKLPSDESNEIELWFIAV